MYDKTESVIRFTVSSRIIRLHVACLNIEFSKLNLNNRAALNKHGNINGLRKLITKAQQKICYAFFI